MTTRTQAPVQSRPAEERPPLQLYARLAGVLFVVLLVLGPISILFIPSQLVVEGDPGATFVNLTDSEGLFRLAIVLDTVILLVEIAMAALLYALFRRVSQPLALLTALARSAQAAVMGANLLLYFVVLSIIVGATGYLESLGRPRSRALRCCSWTPMGTASWWVRPSSASACLRWLPSSGGPGSSRGSWVA